MSSLAEPVLISLRTTTKANKQTNAALSLILAIPLLLTKNVSDYSSRGFRDGDENLEQLLHFASQVCSEVDIRKLADNLSQSTVASRASWALEAAQAVFELEREHDSYKSRKDSFYSLYCEKKQLVEQLMTDMERLKMAQTEALDQKNSEWLNHLRERERELSTVTEQLRSMTEQLCTCKRQLQQCSEEWQREKAGLLSRLEVQSHDNQQLICEVKTGRALSAGMAADKEDLSKVLEQSKRRAAELSSSLDDSRLRIEQFLADQALLQQEITKLKNQLSANRTENVASIMKENKNLRSAVRFLEKAKMEKENEIVAVRFQLTEYQRKYGAFGPTHYFDATHSPMSTDGVQRARLPSQDRKCPFCHVDFGKEDVSFVNHVKTCSKVQ